jgi:hypothetical protein
MSIDAIRDQLRKIEARERINLQKRLYLHRELDKAYEELGEIWAEWRLISARLQELEQNDATERT